MAGRPSDRASEGNFGRSDTPSSGKSSMGGGGGSSKGTGGGNYSMARADAGPMYRGGVGPKGYTNNTPRGFGNAAVKGGIADRQALGMRYTGDYPKSGKQGRVGNISFDKGGSASMSEPSPGRFGR